MSKPSFTVEHGKLQIAVDFKTKKSAVEWCINDFVEGNTDPLNIVEIKTVAVVKMVKGKVKVIKK